MEHLKEFIPVRIGNPDFETRQKLHTLYETLASRLTVFKWEYESVMNVKILSLSDVMECLGKDISSLKRDLQIKYVKANNLAFEGLSLEKLIEQNLLELPESIVNILDMKRNIDKVIQDILKSTLFYFPISGLFDEETNSFALNDEFDSQLVALTESYTESQEQNDALAAFEKLIEGLNGLVKLKILKARRDIWLSLEQIGNAAIISPEATDPLAPDPIMFQLTPFNRYAGEKVRKSFAREKSSLLR